MGHTEKKAHMTKASGFAESPVLKVTKSLSGPTNYTEVYISTVQGQGS